jgi:hypothetical protein
MRKTPDFRTSPTIMGELRKLEAERNRIEDELGRMAENARLKAGLNGLSEQDARALLAQWMEEDGTTVEERRAALAQIVDKIEFDSATGCGHIRYRIGLSGAKFSVNTKAPRAATTQRVLTGVSWRPHGEPSLTRLSCLGSGKWHRHSLRRGEGPPEPASDRSRDPTHEPRCATSPHS